MKVFISSTYVDLEQYREKARDVVLQYECVLLAMEYFGAQPKEPKKICEDKIKECDLFIGIYAHRYGFVPEGGDKSITQLEYELAKELGKPCLSFIVMKGFPWNPDFIEMENYKPLQDFLSIVKKEKTIKYFESPSDFESKLSSSLGKYITNQNGTPQQNENACLLPRAPYPYIAHPYALPQHFTGRRAEMDILSNWFLNEEEPVLILEAIGGMGKSAMSWVWLNREIIKRGEKKDGVFWWSFYDEPFESFILHLYCYITRKETIQSIDYSELLATLIHRRFLLILDGLERALRGYSGMEAMYIQENKFHEQLNEDIQWDKRQREPIHPFARKFLQALCSGKTKTLITTRLTPTPLEEIAGVKHMLLWGLSEEDTVAFLRSEGINGTRAEMEQAGKVYESHPLMLKLLASSIKRSRVKDIKEAFTLNLINIMKPHEIVVTAYNLLSKKERKVATTVSVFRSVFTFEAVKTLFPKKLFKTIKESRLWEILQELCSLGFLFYDEKKKRFDFHPIMRSFLYSQLTTSGGTLLHEMAVQYFQAMPQPLKIVSLEDLAPVIELYHHLVKAQRFDEAYQLFSDRINIPTYYQLSAYHLRIELLKELFPKGYEDGLLPCLKEELNQALTLNELANTYALSGQPKNAVPLYLLFARYSEKNNNKINLLIGLGNTACMAQIHLGQFSAASTHLRKRIFICRVINDEYGEAIAHQELGRVLAFQGSAVALEELAKSTSYWKNINYYQGMSVDNFYRSLFILLQARLITIQSRKEDYASKYSLDVLEHVRQALSFAREWSEIRYPTPRDFVRAYCMLGEALIHCSILLKTVKIKSFSIPFYDKHFQSVIETMEVSIKNTLIVADRCLNEALHRCRNVNLVELEPVILLALVRLNLVQNQSVDETLLAEIHEIAQCSGYRIIMADLHLFCGQALLQLNGTNSTNTILGLTTRDHLLKTKEYALDVSELSHLYQPVKSSADEFYKGIPEYQELKRGMTNQERIKNGYYVAYQIADYLLSTIL